MWDGVRAIAMMWVVIGHTYEMSIVGGSNLLDFKAISVKPFLLVLEAGIFSVDIFFSLGGFFLAFILLRNKITGQVCGFGILQRALRIWPAYILAMMFYYSLLPKVGSGIFWGLVQRGLTFAPPCGEKSCSSPTSSKTGRGPACLGAGTSR